MKEFKKGDLVVDFWGELYQIERKSEIDNEHVICISLSNGRQIYCHKYVLLSAKDKHIKDYLDDKLRNNLISNFIETV